MRFESTVVSALSKLMGGLCRLWMTLQWWWFNGGDSCRGAQSARRKEFDSENESLLYLDNRVRKSEMGGRCGMWDVEVLGTAGSG